MLFGVRGDASDPDDESWGARPFRFWVERVEIEELLDAVLGAAQTWYC
jgi:hypothetical protein